MLQRSTNEAEHLSEEHKWLKEATPCKVGAMFSTLGPRSFGRSCGELRESQDLRVKAHDIFVVFLMVTGATPQSSQEC